MKIRSYSAVETSALLKLGYFATTAQLNIARLAEARSGKVYLHDIVGYSGVTDMSVVVGSHVTEPTKACEKSIDDKILDRFQDSLGDDRFTTKELRSFHAVLRCSEQVLSKVGHERLDKFLGGLSRFCIEELSRQGVAA